LTCQINNPSGVSLGASLSVSEIEKYHTSSGKRRYKVKLSSPIFTAADIAAKGGYSVSWLAANTKLTIAVLSANEFEILPGFVGATSSIFPGTDSRLYIPISLFDDDADPSGVLLPYSPMISSLSEVMKQASINASLDHCGNSMNMTSIGWASYTEASEATCDCCTLESDAYWSVHNLSAWQFVYLQDADFDAESDPYSGFTPLEYTIAGATSPSKYKREHENVTQGCQSSLIFRETSRDLKGDIENALSHEIGHQFGFTHGDDKDPVTKINTCNIFYSSIGVSCSNFGLMSPIPGSSSDYFIPFHLNLIRSRSSAPGK
jgi:hypothetical protein